MILATDAHYAAGVARCGGVGFHDWTDPAPARTWITESPTAAPYAPGAFYLRELPPLLDLLGVVDPLPGTIVIDGYVHLDAEGRKGLGAHLFDALDGTVPVVGVAKRPFRGSPHAVEVRRGRSRRPLWVTAVGLPAREAAARVASMHGSARIPELLRVVDRLCRRGG